MAGATSTAFFVTLGFLMISLLYLAWRNRGNPQTSSSPEESGGSAKNNSTPSNSKPTPSSSSSSSTTQTSSSANSSGPHPQEATKTVTCDSCGVENEAFYKFCSECAEPL